MNRANVTWLLIALVMFFLGAGMHRHGVLPDIVLSTPKIIVQP